MGYEPWPPDSCSLAEARSRITDNHSFAVDAKAGVQVATDALCRSLLSGTLIAYGTPADSSRRRNLIPRNLWQTGKIEWAASKLHSDLPDATFSCVTVLPLLLAPDGASFLNGKTLAEAFKQYVLEDPEVLVLSKAAISEAPEYEAVYHRARCHPYGEAVWPIKVGGWLAGIASPQDRTSPIGRLLVDGDPQEVIDAADALRARFDALFGMLRGGELTGQGLTVSDGIEREIPKSVWSHEDFSADLALGDIVQFNKDAREKADFYIRRWMGVMLSKPSAPNAQPVAHPVPVPSSDQAAPLEEDTTNRTGASLPSKAKATRECETWLASEMLKSPHHRVRKKNDWWGEAAVRFEKRLSRRGFNLAWDMAAAKTNATAWTKAGAPKKVK